MALSTSNESEELSLSSDLSVEQAACESASEKRERSDGYSSESDRASMPLPPPASRKRSELKASNPQLQPEEISPEGSPLGLKLLKSDELLHLLQTRLPQGINEENAETDNSQTNQSKRGKRRLGESEDLPARNSKKGSNFLVSSLRIGDWERRTIFQGDIVGKFNFARRKLIWEVMGGVMKMRIEIKWGDILAMRAYADQYDLNILEVELVRPPMFFREADPLPRKHTNWQITPDFTGNQASLYRVHQLRCLPGKFKKHYQKLVNWDDWMRFVSQTPLPTAPSPYFYYYDSSEANAAEAPYEPRLALGGMHPVHRSQFASTDLDKPIAPITPVQAAHSFQPYSSGIMGPGLITYQGASPVQILQPTFGQTGAASSSAGNSNFLLPAQTILAFPPPQEYGSMTERILGKRPFAFDPRLGTRTEVSVVQSIIQNAHFPQNYPFGTLAGMGRNEVYQNASQVQAFPTPVRAPFLHPSPPFNLSKNGAGPFLGYMDQAHELCADLGSLGPQSSTASAPCISNGWMESMANNLVLREIENRLLSDPPLNLHPSEDRVLHQVNSLYNLLESHPKPIANANGGRTEAGFEVQPKDDMVPMGFNGAFAPFIPGPGPGPGYTNGESSSTYPGTGFLTSLILGKEAYGDFGREDL